MERYLSIEHLFNNAKKNNKKVWEYILCEQCESLNLAEDVLYNRMKDQYEVMCTSIKEGMNNTLELKIEPGDDAKVYKKYLDTGKSLVGEKIGRIAQMALAVSSLNASMGRIVACPTAGSAGILPACLIGIRDEQKFTDDDIIKSLFTSAGVGMVFANITGVAGAVGGCQAECGVAQAMASASIVELMGGNIEQMENAIALCIKSIEGLACDPVAGLVECPCIKRNATCAVNAVLCADMALAGIKSIIPVDEVIQSMKQVGKIMDDRLKETATGGLATTKTGLELANKVFYKN